MLIVYLVLLSVIFLMLDVTEKTVQACATYDSQRTCQWSGSVRIRLCNLYGETFYVYRLPVPPGCPLSYCVDAATSRRNCTPPEIWITDKYRCGVPTAVPTTTPTTKSTAKAYASTPTTPSPDGWRNWEQWSECSRTCDYGLQTRRRICRQSRLPCNGTSTMSQPCNKKNCQIPGIPQEQSKGIVLILGSSEAGKDTLSLVLLNQDIIYQLLRVSLNRICSKNASLCCGSNYRGNARREVEFVITSGVYQVPGSLHKVSGGNVSMQIVAVVDETVYQKVCRSDSQPITTLRKRSVVPTPTMLLIVVDARENIIAATGLDVVDAKPPSTGGGGGEKANDCPVSSCVVPLVIAILGAIGAITGIVFPVLKFYQRKGTDNTPAQELSLTIASSKNDSEKKLKRLNYHRSNRIITFNEVIFKSK